MRAAWTWAPSPRPTATTSSTAEAEDKVGNRVVVSSTLTIHEGGKPRADVAGGEIDWQGEMKRGRQRAAGRHASASPPPWRTSARCRSARPGPGRAKPTSSPRTTTPWPSSDNENVLVPAGGHLALRHQFRHDRRRLPVPLGDRSAGRPGGARHRRRGRSTTCCPASAARSAAASSSMQSPPVGTHLLVGRPDPRVRGGGEQRRRPDHRVGGHAVTASLTAAPATAPGGGRRELQRARPVARVPAGHLRRPGASARA